MILFETHGRVGLIRLNRPEALNALCDQLMEELGSQLQAFDSDPGIGAIVLTGSDRAFAAGADIKEMQHRTYPGTLLERLHRASGEVITTIRTPVVAAVAGYALGGGCELAMMADFIVCADNARFGPAGDQSGCHSRQPGARSACPVSIGKSKAMDMVLTGRQMDAAEAERAPASSPACSRLADLLTEALNDSCQDRIASLSPVANYRRKTRGERSASRQHLTRKVCGRRGCIVPAAVRHAWIKRKVWLPSSTNENQSSTQR